MVSNEEIKKRLEGKRKGIKPIDLIPEQNETASDEFNIVCTDCGTENTSISNFCCECGKPIEVKTPGYVVCDLCYGIYELGEEESSEDFINSQCQCGGNITFIQDIDELEDLNKKCPVCDYTNPYNSKRCENCGRCFDIGMEYFESPIHDIEITSNALRIYNKGDKKLTDVYQYYLDKMTDFSIVKDKFGSNIQFYYETKEINIELSSEQAHNIGKIFNIEQEVVICPNRNCEYDRLLSDGENCPECGIKSKRVVEENYSKILNNKKAVIDVIKKGKKAAYDFKCPACLAKNNANQTSCRKCGKDFTETLGFFKGGYSSSKMWYMPIDLEITPEEIIVYPRTKNTEKREKKTKNFPRKDIYEVRIRKVKKEFSFNYDGEHIVYGIKPEYLDELERLLGTTLKKRQIELKLKEEYVTKGLIKEVKGFNGQLELYEYKLVIRRKGSWAFIAHGWKGDKEILIKHISSIQFKRVGTATRGYIQFAFIGGTESKLGIFAATIDENSIMFDSHQENDFAVIKEMIESKMLEQQGINTSTPSKPRSNINDLEKLGELKDKGIISEEEFQAKKKQILGL